jgi:hypothetical protein
LYTFSIRASSPENHHPCQEATIMPANSFPTNLITQAQAVILAWNEISTKFLFGGLTPAALTEDISTSTALQNQIISLEKQLAELREERDKVKRSLWEKLKRVRAGVMANFGDDSIQYEMIGGTRMSERKSRRPKSPPTAK